MRIHWSQALGLFLIVGCGRDSLSITLSGPFEPPDSGTLASGGTGGTADGGDVGGNSGSGGGLGADAGGNPVDDCSQCHASATCDASGPTLACRCEPGFEQQGGASSPCVDIDECATGTDDCDVNATCTNGDGSFACACNEGYAGDGTACADVDECATSADDCDPVAICTNTDGAFTCACPAGYDDTNSDGTACADIDECATGADNCDAIATCANTDGAFTCTCPTGYDDTNSDGTACADIDECATGADNCDAAAVCDGSAPAGSFSCTCPSGYTDPNGDGTLCTDINECASNLDNCDPLATCTNTGGGFGCACPTGYDDANGDGTVCTDIDECTAGTDNCSANAACANAPGGFNCTCNPGFSGNGVTCTDIDECTAGTDNCSANAACNNTTGGFNCTCNPGFSGNGVTCTDINECTAGTDNCSANAACNNTTGGFNCSCNPGFSGNGVTCTDINECTAGTDNCDPTATCANTTGSFTCTCPPGYSGDGVQTGAGGTGCALVSDCSSCDPLATCNAGPPVVCTCPPGYSGNGTTCTDIDECAAGTDNCDPDAICDGLSPAGSFSCACPAGMLDLSGGNGTDCQCDLNGTFAVLTETDVEWDAVIIFGFTAISAGADTLFAWSLRTQTVSGSTVSVSTKLCGGTSPDLCSPFFNEAYGQTIPYSLFDTAYSTSTTPPTGIAPVLSTMSILDASPGQPFVGSDEIAFNGLALTGAPDGTWPLWDANTSSFPGISWLDPDQDGVGTGTSSFVNTGSSSACGRVYADIPLPDTPSVTVETVHLGSRVISNIDGTIDTCDEMSGTVAGPDNGFPQANGHVIGCIQTGGTACSQSEWRQLDREAQTAAQRSVGSRFTMIRVPDATTCAEIRAPGYFP